MKALILAAGKGSRLKPLTDNCPKPMLQIAGIPMIERIMRSIHQQTGIGSFVLIVGYRSDVVKRHFGDGSKMGWEIDYVLQHAPAGVGDAVNCAQSLLANCNFIMTYGDIMLDAKDYRGLMVLQSNIKGGSDTSIVSLNWVEDPYLGAAVYLNDDGTIAIIDEKPPKGTATTHWNNAGLFYFTPNIFEFTNTLIPSRRGELELPDALTAMINSGQCVRSYQLTGSWRDVGTLKDYEEINLEFEVHQ